MRNLKLIYKLLFVVAFAFALSACGSKKDSNKANLSKARRTTISNNNNLPRPNNADPNGISGNYGKIYNGGDMTNAVANFLGASDLSQIGTVSGQQNSFDGTGVVFEGRVNANCQARTGSGNIRIYIWDSLAANNQAGAIIVDMELKGLTNNCELYFEDPAGSLVLDGWLSNGVFSGRARFTGSNGNNGDLGSFFIPGNAFIN